MVQYWGQMYMTVKWDLWCIMPMHRGMWRGPGVVWLRKVGSVDQDGGGLPARSSGMSLFDMRMPSVDMLYSRVMERMQGSSSVMLCHSPKQKCCRFCGLM